MTNAHTRKGKHVPITKRSCTDNKNTTMKGRHVAITNMSSLTNMPVACADLTTQDDSRDPFRQCNGALGCMYLDHSQSIQQYSRRITVVFIMLFVSRKDRFFKKISGKCFLEVYGEKGGCQDDKA